MFLSYYIYFSVKLNLFSKASNNVFLILLSDHWCVFTSRRLSLLNNKKKFVWKELPYSTRKQKHVTWLVTKQVWNIFCFWKKKSKINETSFFIYNYDHMDQFKTCVLSLVMQVLNIGWKRRGLTTKPPNIIGICSFFYMKLWVFSFFLFVFC